MPPIFGTSGDITASMEQEFLDFSPFYVTFEDMGKLLYVTCGADLRKDLRLDQCDHIMKALVIYVTKTPDAFKANNLFQQNQEVDHSHLFDTWTRNWQWVLAFTRPYTADHGVVLFRESVARKIGVLIGSYKDGVGPAHRIAQVVGFWLVKLYMARDIEWHMFPLSLQTAYKGFLSWRGPIWEYLSAGIPFSDKLLMINGVTRSIFSKAVVLRHQHVFRTSYAYTNSDFQQDLRNENASVCYSASGTMQQYLPLDLSRCGAQVEQVYMKTEADIDPETVTDPEELEQPLTLSNGEKQQRQQTDLKLKIREGDTALEITNPQGESYVTTEQPLQDNFTINLCGRQQVQSADPATATSQQEASVPTEQPLPQVEAMGHFYPFANVLSTVSPEHSNLASTVMSLIQNGQKVIVISSDSLPSQTLSSPPETSFPQGGQPEILHNPEQNRLDNPACSNDNITEDADIDKTVPPKKRLCNRRNNTKKNKKK